MNEKEQIIANIRTTEENMAELVRNEQEYFEARDKLNKYNSQWNLSFKIKLIIIIILWSLGLTIADAHVSQPALQAVLILIVFFFPLILWKSISIKSKKLQKNHDKIYAEHTEISSRVLSWLPPQYRELFYFYKIIELVQYGRANSLGMALNIIADDERAEDIKDAVNIINYTRNL